MIKQMKYKETVYFGALDGSLKVIGQAARDRGDFKVANLTTDLLYAIEDWMVPRDVEVYIPSEEKITEAFSEQ